MEWKYKNKSEFKILTYTINNIKITIMSFWSHMMDDNESVLVWTVEWTT